MIWVILLGAVIIALLILLSGRRQSARANVPDHIHELSRTSRAIVGLLAQQAILFGHDVGTGPSEKAGDDWSNGYIHGFSRYVLDQSGEFHQTEVAAAVASIFEQLFGRSESKRINALRDIAGEREISARSGFLIGEKDARRFLESGGKAGATGWLQHVKSGLFSSSIA
jgi:hypothetical protein